MKEQVAGMHRKSLGYRIQREVKSNWQLMVLALPAVVLLFIFNYVPYFGLLLSFKDYRYNLGLLRSPWVGFRNFQYLFAGKDVMLATRNTVLYNTAFLISGLVVAIGFALMLFELKSRWVKTYQTIFFLPYFISWVVASYVLMAFLDMDYGVMNHLLARFGVKPIMWYNQPKYWPAIFLIANIWKGMGYNIIIFYTELMAIDETYYEAARLDGASRLQEIWYITLPFLRRVAVLLIIMNIGKMFSGDFGMFYNLPLNSSLLYRTTDVLDTYVYRALITLGDMGMSSAATTYQSVVGFVLVLISNAIVRKIDSENAVF